MVGAEVGPQMSVPIQCIAVDRVLRLVELEIPDNVLAQDKTTPSGIRLTGVRNRPKPSRMSPDNIPDRSPGPTAARSRISKSEIVSFSVTHRSGSIFFQFFPGA